MRYPSTTKTSERIKAQWFQDLERAVLQIDPTLAGKIEWDTANYLRLKNLLPTEAAPAVVKASQIRRDNPR